VDLDLRLVRYVLGLAEELHFGRAAARLHITQQTLSAQVSKLESQLGVVLFIRDHRHVELTAAGALFAERGRRLLTDAGDMLTEVTAAVPIVRLDMVTEGLPLSALAAELRSRLPTTALEFTQAQGLSAAIPQLLAAELDAAFGWVGGLREPLSPILGHRVVMRAPLGLVLPRDHPLAGLDKVTSAELAAHPILVHTAREAIEWERWNEMFVAEFGLRVAERLHGHGRASVNAAVLAYGHPAIGPLNVTVPKGLVVRPLVAPVPLYEWSMVWRLGNSVPSVVQVLKLITQISAASAWAAPPAGGYWMPLC
jgi:DNA-binding transcriptional LysR family regulator